MADIFDGIEEVEVAPQSLPWFNEGTYLVKVDMIKSWSSKKLPRRNFTGGEFTILEAKGPEGHNKVGTRASRAINMSPDNPYALKEVKELFGAVMGEEPNKVTQKTAMALVDAKNPAAGRTIIVEAVRTKKKDGGDFVKYRYTPAAQKK